MDPLQRDLAGAARAHRALEATIAELTDDQAREPSLLPGWSRGHVLTHIARNADSFTRMVCGAQRGEMLDQYPGGPEQRAGDIEAGSGRAAAELITDIRRSNAELEAAWAATDADTWQRQGIATVGPVAIDDLPFRRWREAGVHHADLGLGYRWSDWPADYVRLELDRMTMMWNSRLPMGMTGLPAAALAVPDHHRLAWLMGRADIDGVEPAGLWR